MDYVLKTIGLSKKLGKGLVVNNLNLNIKKGDIYGFIGPNGAGKTTAMKVILGLLFPTSGTIELFGEPRNEHSLRKVGALIEAPGLYTGCTAYENMKRYSILSGGTDKDIYEKLELVGLADTGKKKVKAFSLGMKQRLGIALALLGNPELLILDEPVNGLDPMGMKAMRDVIHHINQEYGITFFISSHLLGELEKISTVYGIINKGVLTEEITAEQLEEQCSQSVRVRCDDPLKAIEILKTHLNIPKVEQDGNLLNVLTNPVRAAEINTELVKNNIQVSELGIKSMSYEDYFISRMNMPVPGLYVPPMNNGMMPPNMPNPYAPPVPPVPQKKDEM